MSFTKISKTIEEGSTVFLYGGRESITSLVVKRGAITNSKFGAFSHDSLIGLPYGAKVYSKNKSGWMHALAPTVELWSKALLHRTQILYLADVSLIVQQLEIRPGSIVVESGTPFCFFFFLSPLLLSFLL
jgi:tRNA (adenine57-N1/adenine58-N1)-methyltransferase